VDSSSTSDLRRFGAQLTSGQRQFEGEFLAPRTTTGSHSRESFTCKFAVFRRDFRALRVKITLNTERSEVPTGEISGLESLANVPRVVFSPLTYQFRVSSVQLLRMAVSSCRVILALFFALFSGPSRFVCDSAARNATLAKSKDAFAGPEIARRLAHLLLRRIGAFMD